MKKSGFELTLVANKSFHDYPSASSIAELRGKLYITGDDARDILVLDSSLREINRIPITDSGSGRIAKEDKPDYESVIVTARGAKEILMLIGSGSTNKRESALAVYAEASAPPSPIRFSAFIKQLKTRVPEVNIEGASVYKDKILLSNRSNTTNKTNHLIETQKDFYAPDNAAIRVRSINLPNEITAGLSDLAYDPLTDILFFSATTEKTANAYDDGAIGDSYLGRITDFSNQSSENIDVTEIMNLTSKFPELKGQKIEGIHITDKTLYAVSDNDDGKSRVFIFRITLP